MIRRQLHGQDLHDWIALRRVSEGLVAQMDGCWFDAGRPTSSYVRDTLRYMTLAGMVELRPRNNATFHRASLTETGRQWYAHLCSKTSFYSPR